MRTNSDTILNDDAQNIRRYDVDVTPPFFYRVAKIDCHVYLLCLVETIYTH